MSITCVMFPLTKMMAACCYCKAFKVTIAPAILHAILTPLLRQATSQCQICSTNIKTTWQRKMFNGTNLYQKWGKNDIKFKKKKHYFSVLFNVWEKEILKHIAHQLQAHRDVYQWPNKGRPLNAQQHSSLSQNSKGSRAFS
jgi:hypothetical protein